MKLVPWAPNQFDFQQDYAGGQQAYEQQQNETLQNWQNQGGPKGSPKTPINPLLGGTPSPKIPLNPYNQMSGGLASLGQGGPKEPSPVAGFNSPNSPNVPTSGFNQFNDQLTGFGETLGGYGETLGGYGKQIGGFGEQMSGVEKTLGGFGDQFEGLNNRLDSMEKGIASLSQQFQPQQPSYNSPMQMNSYNPYNQMSGGLASLGLGGGWF